MKTKIIQLCLHSFLLCFSPVEHETEQYGSKHTIADRAHVLKPRNVIDDVLS